VARRNREKGRPEPFAGGYEGPEVLSALLARAGSPHDAEATAEHFRAAQSSGEPRNDVIPGLFPEEPRFDAPADARRLYANLFGLWERVKAGLDASADEPAAVTPEPTPPPLPLARGSLLGRVLTPDFVESAWRWLEALPERESRRLRDRFSNTQPDLAAWIDEVELPETGELAARDLLFESWAMMDRAFGDRLGALDWKELRELEQEPPVLESAQPALAAYAAEQLDILEDEDPGFGPAERAQVERVLATVGTAFTQAVAKDG
jgi:hypothetical protein